MAQRGIYTLLAPFLLVIFLSGCGQQEPAKVLAIETKSGKHTFSIEIADEPDEQIRGLMFRKDMKPDHGMLFVYENEQMRSMWMRNTYISLDMLFLKSDGRIYHIHRDAEPFSEKIISSQEPGLAVLELVAGTVDKLDIKVGDYIRHSAFKK